MDYLGRYRRKGSRNQIITVQTNGVLFHSELMGYKKLTAKYFVIDWDAEGDGYRCKFTYKGNGTLLEESLEEEGKMYTWVQE